MWVVTMGLSVCFIKKKKREPQYSSSVLFWFFVMSNESFFCKMIDRILILKKLTVWKWWLFHFRINTYGRLLWLCFLLCIPIIFHGAHYSTVTSSYFKIMFDFLVCCWIFSIYGSTDSRKVQLCYTASLNSTRDLHCALRGPLVCDHYKNFADASCHWW